MEYRKIEFSISSIIMNMKTMVLQLD